MSATAARNDDFFDQAAPAPPVAPPSRSRRGRRLPPGPAPVRDPAPVRGPSPAPVRQPASRPRRRVTVRRDPVAPPRPVAAPRTPFVLLVLVLVAAGIVGLLVLNTRINENSFQLERLRAEQAALDVEEQRLESALARKEYAGNLEAKAKQLGLVPLGETYARLELPDGTVIGVPKPVGAGTNRGE